MSEWHWTAINPDGQILGLLANATQKQATWYVDQAATCTFHLPGFDPMALDMNELTTDIAITLGTEPWFLGRLGTSQDDLSADRGHDITFTGIDYRGILTTRRIVWPGSDIDFSGQDLADVAWNLIEDSQQLPQGRLGIEKGHFQKTGTIFKEALSGFSQSQFPTISYGDLIGQDIDTLSNAAGGSTQQGIYTGLFEWEIDASLRFNLWAPGRGIDRTASLVLEYGGNVSAVTRMVDTQQFANALFVTGSWSPQLDPGIVRNGSQNVIDPNCQSGQVGWTVIGGDFIPYSDARPTKISKVYQSRTLPAIDTYDLSLQQIVFASDSGLDGPPPGLGGNDAYGNPIRFGDVFQIAQSGGGVLDGTYYTTSVSSDGKTVTWNTNDVNANDTVPTKRGVATVPAQFEMFDPSANNGLGVAVVATGDRGSSGNPWPIYISKFVAVKAPGISYLTGLMQQPISNTEVVSMSVLDQWAQTQLVQYGIDYPSYQCQLTPGWWTPDQLWLGDVVQLVVKSGRLNVTALYRVVQVDIVWPDDADIPQVTVSLNRRPPRGEDRLRNYKKRIANLERR